ncbi:cytidine deaminase [Corynebacterium guangdongense]|uniref:Cytidine deaminase n=1 Tax=Corynebacterium guangdongense TaxID=1783348 RepID=A0ABU1ZXH5_9CORY|nr:cytidine deaminase [Corynebacterium guangdongense]MDR7329634.1 cytidine deaminase [Corynebacterium guangdongense]WJZ18199.1 Cytidine deaminase [Corynebacterium guangdongense]
MRTPAALLADAGTAAANSYSPYSGFAVGAAVLTAAGEVVTGCNVENAAYGESICAERNAVTTMVARGWREIEAVAIVGLRAAPCWPCGACRQVLREFGCRRVIVESADGQPLSLDFEALLPHSFGPDALGN